MNEAYCCECMRESCSTRAKLAFGNLETERQKVPGLHITQVFDRKQLLKYHDFLRRDRVTTNSIY